MGTLVETTTKMGATSAIRFEDHVLEVYCCVLATLGGRTRMYQWLAHDATEEQKKATNELAKSYRSYIPLIGHAVVGALGFTAIMAIAMKNMDAAKPFELIQGIAREGQSCYGNYAQADRSEDQASSERAQMFYQKYIRDESSADSERSRLIQAIGEIFRGELEAMRSMDR